MIRIQAELNRVIIPSNERTKENDKNKHGQIESLQALRALAFLGIFFLHAHFFVSWPSLGVSVFFVLSGFLLQYTHDQKSTDISIKKCLKFSVDRIKKLYPLHIITMLFASVRLLAVIVRNGSQIGAWVNFVTKIILNCTLTQTWVPYSTICTSLNGVAWFLSVMLFLYVLFYPIAKIVRTRNLASLMLICAGILVGEVILCIPLVRIFGNDSPIYIWFMYYFPVFRIGDFFVGCVLGKLYEKFDHDISMITGTICEIIAIAVCVLIALWSKQNHTSIILQALFNMTTVYIPLAAIWVYLFAIKRGGVTKLLTNKLFVYMGNVSAYAFLIHYVITRYVSFILEFQNIEVNGFTRGVLVLGELILTLFLSELYKRNMHRRIAVRKGSR